MKIDSIYSNWNNYNYNNSISFTLKFTTVDKDVDIERSCRKKLSHGWLSKKCSNSQLDGNLFSGAQRYEHLSLYMSNSLPINSFPQLINFSWILQIRAKYEQWIMNTITCLYAAASPIDCCQMRQLYLSIYLQIFHSSFAFSYVFNQETDDSLIAYFQNGRNILFIHRTQIWWCQPMFTF